MPEYSFRFAPSVAGFPVTITDADGATVDTGTAGTPSETNGAVIYTVNLPAGEYTGVAAKDGHQSSKAKGVSPLGDVDTINALDHGYAPRSALAPRRTQPPKISRMLTAFQTGHGWFTGGADNDLKNLDDTSDYVLGAQSALIVTQANTTTTATFSAYPVGPYDFTSKQFVVWVKAENMDRLGGILFQAGSAGGFTTDYYTLRVSGGAVANSILGEDEWVAVPFSFSDAAVTGAPNRAAINALRFRVSPNGANAEATRVRFNGLALTDEPATLYPNGVVTLSFDDNYASVFTRAKATMSRYGFPGTAFVIADTVDTTDRLSTAQLHELEDVNGWEVAGHSWTAASHNLPFGLNDVSEENLDAEMRQLKGWLLDQGFRGADHFAYPKGRFDNGTTEEVVGRYFATAGMTSYYIKQATPTFKPLRLARVSVAATDTTAALQALIDDAYTNRTWLNLCFHNIVASGAAVETEYNKADFDTVVAYLSTKGIPVRTVGQVIDSL